MRGVDGVGVRRVLGKVEFVIMGCDEETEAVLSSGKI